MTIASPDQRPAIRPIVNRFEFVYQRVPIEQQSIFTGMTREVNPQAGANLLTTNRQEAVPLLFSLLVADDMTVAEKANALSSVRAALVNPSSSNLSEKVPGDPEIFFDSIIAKAGRSNLGFTPSGEARNYVKIMLTNFQTERDKLQAKTMAGENLDILKVYADTPLDPEILIEAVITGVLDRQFPADFRQVLMRTLLYAAENPQYFSEDLFTDNASYNRSIRLTHLIPKIMGVETPGPRVLREEHERQQEQKLQELKDQTIAQQAQSLQRRADNIIRLQVSVALKDGQLLDAQYRIVALELLLAETIAKKGAPQAKLERDPYDVLGLPNTAKPDEIREAYRELQKGLHADIINGILIKGGVDVSERRAQALKKLANRQTQDINLAYDELKKRGKA